MAVGEKKISELTAVITPTDADVLAITQSGASYRETHAQLHTYITGKIDGYDSQTNMEDANTIPIRDSGANKKITFSAFKQSVMLIGQPIALDVDHDALASLYSSLPSYMVTLDGQLISDGDSPFDGYRVRNLNQADVTLTLTWTADGGGSYATVAAADLLALNVGDAVVIDGTYTTYITDITGTTVTVLSTSATGTDVTSVFTGRARYITGASASGGSRNDALQKITGSINYVKFGNPATGELADTPNGAFSDNDTGGVASTSGLDYTIVTSYNKQLLLFDNSDSETPSPAKTDDDNTRGPELDMVYVTRIK